MSILESVRKEFKKVSSPQRKKTNEWFFKTGKGEYGEGDVFMGVSVPETKKIAKKYFGDLGLGEIKTLLESPIHEERLLALMILEFKYSQNIKNESQIETTKRKLKLKNFYVKNIKRVNNWDLVDSSAQYILGDYIFNFGNKDSSVLYKFAKSKNLWEKRVAVIACFYFIQQKEIKTFFEIVEILKSDKHDLIQKAIGWMLREVYKRCDEGVVRKFLEGNIKTIPRTTLRYAIEKMDNMERKMWLGK